MKRNNLADHFCCRFSSVSVVRWLPLARSCVNHSKVGSGLVTMVCVFFSSLVFFASVCLVAVVFPVAFCLFSFSFGLRKVCVWNEANVQQLSR